MKRFFLRRAILGVLVCMTVLVISFGLTRVAGDPALAVAGPQATAADVMAIRRAYGLDRPLPEQFLTWVGAVARGDLGRSYLFREPVANLIRTRLPVTLTLGLVGLGFALLIALPLGIVAALHEGTLTDQLVMLVALLGQAMPSFWLALLLIIEFGLRLQWLPISGLDDWTGYLLPGLVLAFSGIPALMRLTRSGMIDALRSDYIRTARAKGLSERKVIYKHGLRSALTPIVTLLGIDVGTLLGGTVVTEKLFGLQGIGQSALNAVAQSDLPVVLGTVLVAALFIVVANILVDITYALLDARVRLS